MRLGYRGRVHYIYSNATISLASMMANYPGTINRLGGWAGMGYGIRQRRKLPIKTAGTASRWLPLLYHVKVQLLNLALFSWLYSRSVYIQFPDPHFKKRHRKRRIFQPDLVEAISNLLPPGGAFPTPQGNLLLLRERMHCLTALPGARCLTE